MLAVPFLSVMMSRYEIWLLRPSAFADNASVIRTSPIKIGISSRQYSNPVSFVFFRCGMVFFKVLNASAVTGSERGATSCRLAVISGLVLETTDCAIACWLMNDFCLSGCFNSSMLSYWCIVMFSSFDLCRQDPFKVLGAFDMRLQGLSLYRCDAFLFVFHEPFVSNCHAVVNL